VESEPIRFGAVDDHDIVLYGVEAMAAREEDLFYCGGASDARTAISIVEQHHPSIMLLDLRLGSSNSFSLCEELVARDPGLAIVMFTAFGNEDLLDGAIKAGAVGYLLKDTSTAGLPDVLRTVQREGAYFDARVVNQALIASRTSKPRAALSERELEILRLVAAGRDNYQIGDELHLSVHMVKFHIAQLLKRYQVHRRAELVRVLMERQVLP
jgi:two-component system response regulator DevR